MTILHETPLHSLEYSYSKRSHCLSQTTFYARTWLFTRDRSKKRHACRTHSQPTGKNTRTGSIGVVAFVDKTRPAGRWPFSLSLPLFPFPRTFLYASTIAPLPLAVTDRTRGNESTLALKKKTTTWCTEQDATPWTEFGDGRGYARSPPDWLLAGAGTVGGAPFRVAPSAALPRYRQRGNFPEQSCSPGQRLPLFIDTYSRVTFSRAGAGRDCCHARLEMWRLW